MARRSLLGGSKRSQQARGRQEAERAWRQEEAAAAEPTQHFDDGPAAVAQLSTEVSADLRWAPGVGGTDEPAEASDVTSQTEAGSAASQRPIHWDLSDGERTESSAPSSPNPAPAWDAPQAEPHAPDEQLIRLAEYQLRQQRLARSGWAVLLAVLTLTLIVSVM